jgi:AcrR family transcriptional regulator
MDPLVQQCIKGSLQRSDSRNCIVNVLEATLELSRSGIAPGIESIAFEAGASKSSIYRHFSGKRQIYEAALQLVLSRLRSAIVILMDRIAVDDRSIDLFTDRLFDTAADFQSALKTLLKAIPQADVDRILLCHRQFLEENTLEAFDPIFGEEHIRVRRTKMEVVFDTMQNIMLEFVRGKPCPVRKDAYRNLFRACAFFFADNFR